MIYCSNKSQFLSDVICCLKPYIILPKFYFNLFHLTVYIHVKKISTKRTKEFKEVFVMWLELLQHNEPGKQITLLMDTKGAGLSNINISIIRFIMECLDEYFPFLLSK